jgi:hypothetical protein
MLISVKLIHFNKECRQTILFFLGGIGIGKTEREERWIYNSGREARENK